MPAHQACQLEHAHAVGAEDGAQFVVGNDGALVFRVLQVVGLDVVPQFFHHLAAAKGAVADDGGKLRAGFESAGTRGFFGLGGGGFFGRGFGGFFGGSACWTCASSY